MQTKLSAFLFIISFLFAVSIQNAFSCEDTGCSDSTPTSEINESRALEHTQTAGFDSAPATDLFSEYDGLRNGLGNFKTTEPPNPAPSDKKSETKPDQYSEIRKLVNHHLEDWKFRITEKAQELLTDYSLKKMAERNRFVKKLKDAIDEYNKYKEAQEKYDGIAGKLVENAKEGATAAARGEHERAPEINEKMDEARRKAHEEVSEWANEELKKETN